MGSLIFLAMAAIMAGLVYAFLDKDQYLKAAVWGTAWIVYVLVTGPLDRLDTDVTALKSEIQEQERLIQNLNATVSTIANVQLLEERLERLELEGKQ